MFLYSPVDVSLFLSFYNQAVERTLRTVRRNVYVYLSIYLAIYLFIYLSIFVFRGLAWFFRTAQKGRAICLGCLVWELTNLLSEL